MKRYITILSLCLSLLLTSCSNDSGGKARDMLESYLGALQLLNMDEAYAISNEIVPSLEGQPFTKEELSKVMYGNLTYNIGKVDSNRSDTTITLTLSNSNYIEVLNMAALNISSKDAIGEMDEEEIGQLLKEEVYALLPKAQIYNTTVNVTLIQIDKKFVIAADREDHKNATDFFEAVLGNGVK